MACYEELRGRSDDKNSIDTILDLSQGLHRIPVGKDVAPCIIPNSILWSRRRCRCLFANEALALQGFQLLPRDRLSSFSHMELMSLAGNAFCGHNVMAILIAILSVYEWPQVCDM